MERFSQFRQIFPRVRYFGDRLIGRITGLPDVRHFRESELVLHPQGLVGLSHNMDILADSSNGVMAKALGIAPEAVEYYRFRSTSVQPSMMMEAFGFHAIAPMVSDVLIAPPDVNISCYEFRHNYNQYYAVVAINDKNQPQLFVRGDGGSEILFSAAIPDDDGQHQYLFQRSDGFVSALRYEDSFDSSIIIGDSLELDFILHQKPDCTRVIYAGIVTKALQGTISIRAMPFGLVCQALNIEPSVGDCGEYISAKDLENIRV